MLILQEETSPKLGSNVGDDEDDKSYLLPEFNQILLQFRAEECQERMKLSEMEDEIFRLRSLVDSLQERERNLELKLLEYYGVEEQTAADVRELENRAQIIAVKDKLFSLKIDSLLLENKRLVGQVSDRAVQVNCCKEKIKELEVKLTAAEKTTAASVGEATRLREENVELTYVLDRLKTDRCNDVEELVYLKWVNACLRFELRNYRPRPSPDGESKMVARELSHSMSPNSEEKAKQLIFEYANLDDSEDSLMEFMPENRRSTSSGSGHSEESTGASSGQAKNGKSKFLSKLKKLVSGKYGSRSNKNRLIPQHSFSDNAQVSYSDSGLRVSDSTTCSLDDIIGRYSNGEDDRSKMTWDSTSSDIQRLNQPSAGDGRCRSDLGLCGDFKRFEFGADHVDLPEKVELKKLAGALKNRHTRSGSYT